MRRSKFLLIFVFPVALAFAFLLLLLLSIGATFVFPSLYPSCTDCHARVGFPFSYLDTGVWGPPGGRIILSGAVGDCLIALLIEFWLTRLIWARFLNRGATGERS